MAKLIFTDEKYAGRVYMLVVEKTTVGRGEQNTLVIHDSSLSSTHCEILVNGPEVIVRDLGSRNGTFVNGARLTSQQSQLKSGQTVRFGSVEARLELEEQSVVDDDEETAVHAMRRSLVDQRREKNRTKTPDAAVTFDSGPEPGSADHTVMIPRAAPTEDRTTPPVSAARERPARRIPLVRMIVSAAVLALGLALVRWLIRAMK